MPPVVIVTMDNTDITPIIVFGTADLSEYDATLIVQLGAPLPDGSVLPILQAEEIIGDFTAVEVRRAYKAGCSRVTGELQRADTTISVLLYVVCPLLSTRFFACYRLFLHAAVMSGTAALRLRRGRSW